mmetsp:Transcript_1549/g.2681  ORF Transcript_1549/g.2681 Transcript_1549/m.2681 type:complete len:392 (+) Transcript_1549:77-1252(+)
MEGGTPPPGNEDGENGNHGLDSLGGSNMAPFLSKLFQIVSADATDICIKWTPKGDSFVISDPDTFAREILPTYFKHNNIRSFIRQLNTYGFRKRTNISSADEHLEFFHASFRRDEPGLLAQIKRCHQPKGQTQQISIVGTTPSSAGQVIAQVDDTAKTGQQSPDLDAIRSRVTELKTRLGSLQMEIRDYNQQMEQKVNLLLQILQTSSSPQGASQLQQQIARMQMSMPGGSHGQRQPSLNSYMDQHSSNQQLSATPHNDYLGRRESLLASIGHMRGLGGSGNGSMTGLGMHGNLNMSGLGGGGGLGALNGLVPGTVNGGVGNLSSVIAGLGGMGAGGGTGQNNVSTDGGVAGLQHLLEAAQRYQTEDSVDAARAAKRFCPESAARSEEAHA